ncbi:MAG: radical SAM protein [Candidatus Freyarchaeota archaeon]|nr:radical SAM protein [Candidatus Freyrarchaeum guaymaensis]
MLDIPKATLVKAKLLEYGRVYVDRKRLKYFPDHSTAGPSAGVDCIFLGFEGRLVRLSLAERDERCTYIPNVGVKLDESVYPAYEVESALHCPGQAFLNLDSNCRFNCKFCATPVLSSHVTHRVLREEVVVRIVERVKSKIEGIALTTGVFGTVDETVEHMVRVVAALREYFGDGLPIGVEPLVTKRRHVDMLYSAGADEVKVNVESYDPETFRRVCPKIDYNTNLEMLRYAVRVFGENHVCSNIIVGLGEDEESVDEGVRALAEWGVVASLRPLSVNPFVREQLAEATGGRARRPSAERLLRHALKQKLVLEEKGLDTRKFKTMCLKCTACDIVPQKDL